MLRRLTAALAAAAMSVTLVGTAAADETGRKTYTGEIDGAEYRVEMPADWNGTLLLYSHGYAPEGFGFEDLPMATTNRPMPYGQSTEDELLSRGYALAASNFNPVTGYHVRNGLRDQIALLDWFEANVGEPEHTVSTGQSMGGVLAVQLAERHPDRFDAIATFCAEYDPVGLFNANLDVAFVVKTLLAPDADVDLVKARDPQATHDALFAAIEEAVKTPDGRARLALAAAVTNIPGWYSARYPKPTTDTERIEQQTEWIKYAYTMLATLGRADLESHAGGNPSWNTGVDYGRQLSKSAQTKWVRKAYADADVSLKSDLRDLKRAPRISGDRAAVKWLAKDIARGDSGKPTVTVHSTGDGGAVTDQERWLGEQYRRHGDARQLKQLYVERGGHCTISGGEEITAYETLQRRLDAGRWPTTSPRKLNAQVAKMPAELQMVFDFSTFTDEADTPKFTRFTPPKFLRPTF